MILGKRPDLYGAVGTRRQIQLHSSECGLVGRSVERKQSSIRARPKPSAAVFIQNVDPIGLRVIADGQCREPGSAGRVVAVAFDALDAA